MRALTNKAPEKVTRKVCLSDVIIIYKDPETESFPEGHARVWAILEETDEYYVLQVSFLGDPEAPGRKFTRKYFKMPVKREAQ